MARTKAARPEQPQEEPNRTPSKVPPTALMKSPPQAQELSHEDRASLKDFLERSDKPFSVTTVNPKKRKRSAADTALRIETDLFVPRLSVAYEIQPATNWDSLKRYKRVAVGNESIALGECILVKHDMSQDDPRIDSLGQWKAKVLEVRALDPEHVYIRVAWLNRPEDLAGGRQPHHGKNELIPTNQLDIIDAMTVNGGLNLFEWDDSNDESPMPGIDEYFWRQTYDYANTKTFSAQKLRKFCRDRKPQNPDEMILQCESPKCRKWMHVDCIVKDAVQRANRGTAREGKAVKIKKRASVASVSLDPTPPATAMAQEGAYTAEFLVRGSPNGPDDTPSEVTQIVVTDAEGEQRTEHVTCLFCREPIEPAISV
ncbi:hypothetical protein LTR91_022721 [Friedmanniomyces endolithicus]|uniref:BAH domain-containing protein n=1 Tax=Friedmanniomyces endolithicus TaxID=329885 RepID=A0AAN6JYF1_9PEZI|nr:hypothetical protein LTR94_022555 [Friedmanniomyces endolithicus]KAK0770565.1 hypothetical protein LTR38_017536 [Friedmanniomyces endolithicus]KAK0794915.1 hypothetical protein LTR59_007621 [Friedmanniomyces endolithicus]KAK0837372.1 hypothetical protein LTR03_012838 [Friedmanniomyces endolithicus]KAK0845646.1 hypothetical protein LTS02_015229 [Friedmanniomyces endolithicus]